MNATSSHPYESVLLRPMVRLASRPISSAGPVLARRWHESAVRAKRQNNSRLEVIHSLMTVRATNRVVACRRSTIGASLLCRKQRCVRPTFPHHRRLNRQAHGGSTKEDYYNRGEESELLGLTPRDKLRWPLRAGSKRLTGTFRAFARARSSKSFTRLRPVSILSMSALSMFAPSFATRSANCCWVNRGRDRSRA